MRDLTSAQVEAALEGVSEGLRPIVSRLLAPRREARYATGAQLAQALRDHLWSSGQRHGHAVLAAEVARLTASALDELNAPGRGGRRGRGGTRGRRGGAAKSP